MLHTGLRASEVCALKPEHIHLGKRSGTFRGCRCGAFAGALEPPPTHRSVTTEAKAVVPGSHRRVGDVDHVPVAHLARAHLRIRVVDGFELDHFDDRRDVVGRTEIEHLARLGQASENRAARRPALHCQEHVVRRGGEWLNRADRAGRAVALEQLHERVDVERHRAREQHEVKRASELLHRGRVLVQHKRLRAEPLGVELLLRAGAEHGHLGPHRRSELHRNMAQVA